MFILHNAMPSKKVNHPKSHEIFLVLPNGTKIRTKSTYGKPGHEISLDINPFEHHAWTGKGRFVKADGRVAEYNKKFSGLDILV